MPVSLVISALRLHFIYTSGRIAFINNAAYRRYFKIFFILLSREITYHRKVLRAFHSTSHLNAKFCCKILTQTSQSTLKYLKWASENHPMLLVTIIVAQGHGTAILSNIIQENSGIYVHKTVPKPSEWQFCLWLSTSSDASLHMLEPLQNPVVLLEPVTG